MKIKIICCLVLLVGISSLATAQCERGLLTKSVIDWAQFRFSPSHTGCNPYEFLLSPATVPSLEFASEVHNREFCPFFFANGGERRSVRRVY